VVALVAVAVLLLTSGSGGDEDRVPAVVRAVSPSTVLVEARRGSQQTATGSGWVLDGREGLVVTAGHVVNAGERFRVGGKEAAVVAAAPCEDLALLRVASADGLTAASLGRGSSVEQGETVVALGYAANAAPGDAVTSTRGVVSATSTAFRDPAPDVPAYQDAIQTDTALNPGNSGGPLVDLDGRVIGVNAAARTTGSDGRALEGQNFAIGIDRARGVLRELRRGKSLAWTGATFGYPTTAELVERKLPAGLYVTGAVPGTPAAKASIAGRGEVLVGVDGRRVGTTLQSYCEAMAGHASGSRVRLTLARPGGKTRDVEMALA
jgi:putative serine protease PepD